MIKKYYLFLYIFILISLINSFIISNNYIKYNSKINNKLLKINMINMDDYSLINKIINIEINNKNLGRIIVEKTSSLLPHFDSVGHKILHANNELISYILNLNNIPNFIKKDIVLLTISIAQAGDNLGSHMLQLYYDIVDKCL